MSTEPIKQKKLLLRLILSLLVIFLVCPVLLVIFWQFGERRYYLCSLVMILLAMIPFFLKFETRRPQARELVTLSVLCAIAVAARAAFIMIPHFKPMTAIIMIAAMAFGAESGFLVGAVSAFVSNFIFGQGTWTPWQMLAYGMAGFLAGIFFHFGVISSKKRVATTVFGAAVVMLVVGPVLDLCSVFTMGNTNITKEWVASVFLSGLPLNAVHAAATALTLYVLSRPMMEKLDRIKIKYGMMSEE